MLSRSTEHGFAHPFKLIYLSGVLTVDKNRRRRRRRGYRRHWEMLALLVGDRGEFAQSAGAKDTPSRFNAHG